MDYLYFMIYTFFIISFFSLFACKDPGSSANEGSSAISDSGPLPVDYDTTQWVELTSDDGYIIDIKYATTDNFVKEIIYPCGRCFLKPVAANAMARIKNALLKDGYKLKLFDCYRPRAAQDKLWEKVPDPNYVAPPSEGSMHNRGVAIDLTFTDVKGKELDMGTHYDFFGPSAHHDYVKLPQATLNLRRKLKSIMEEHGFQSIRTEWWHYSYAKGTYPLENWQWNCN